MAQKPSYFDYGFAKYDVTERKQYTGYTGDAITSSIGNTQVYSTKEGWRVGSYPENFIRAVVTLNKDTKVTGGTGTSEDPYVL